RLEPSLWRRLRALSRFRGWRRRFVILEYACNLAEESFLLVRILRLPVLTIRRLGGNRHHLLSPAKEFREEPRYSPSLVTSLVRFGAGHKGRHIVVRTGRRRQSICRL